MRLSYRWLIVAVGAVLGCVALGAMFSLAVFLDPMAQATGWSRTGISSAMTLNFLFMGVGALLWGAASDRYGARPVVAIGVVLLGLALTLASRATTLTQFQLTYGVLVGLSASAFFAPLMALTAAWFDRHRALAVSLVSAGMGVAPMTISPLARWLITTYEWRPAMLIIGLIAWTLLPLALLLRRAPPPAEAVSANGGIATAAPAPSAGDALGSRAFIVLGLTFFACCAAHSGPIFHMVSYAILCGVGPMAAVSIYSVEGLAGLFGRLLFGVLADRLGVKRMIVAGLLVQAFAIGTYTVVNDLRDFYLLALVFGTAYGGVMPLYAVLAREYFGPQVLGTVLGAAMMLSSLGMSFGPLAGGWLFDRFGGYGWLFAGSALVGLAAAAMALAFPPVRGPEALRTA
ncbi:MAG TPA: MFS transporter [Tahibacter sp.]|uniref:MFS transporter n=1 Tax=Tahibacter sp. TaxID=2056211 RepID=UPI002CF44325|nr:MFS transporter [Tahibacter sp.]HSX60502.1 MFS transporter [Tahibacter sp.]